jgi:hypothetical protein
MFVLKFQQPRTRVKVKESCLTASFQDSVPPTVLHLDLSRNPIMTMTVKPEAAEWALKLSLPHGEHAPTILFRQREDAEAAYQALHSGLVRREWLPSGFTRALGTTLAVITTILLVAFLVLMVVGWGKSVPTAGGDLSAINKKPAQMQNGVPQSADDILQLPSP